MIITITTVEELEGILASNEKILLKFSAITCGPCKVQAMIFAELSTDHPEIVFVSVDAAEGHEIVQYYADKGLPLKAVPTIHAYIMNEDGTTQSFTRAKGLQSAPSLLAYLERE